MSLPSESIWNKNFLLLCFNSFFLFLNYYLLAATMPTIVKNDMGGSISEMGLVTSIFVLGNVAFRPISGYLAERFGKKKIMLIFVSLYVICAFSYFGTQTILPLLIIRFFNGMAFSLSTTAMSTLALNSVPKDKKSMGIGYFSMFMSAAMVIGPALGVYLLHGFPFQVILASSAVASLFSLLVSIPVKSNESSPKLSPPFKDLNLNSFFELKAIPVCMAAFFVAFAYSSLISFVSDYTTTVGLESTTLYFFVTLSLFIIIPRPLIMKWYAVYGDHKMVYPFLAIFATGLLLLSQASNLWTMLLSASFLGLGYGALFPILQNICMKNASPTRTSIAMATFFWLFDIGFGIGAYTLASILSITNYPFMYCGAAIMCVCSAVTYWFTYHKKDSSASHYKIS